MRKLSKLFIILMLCGLSVSSQAQKLSRFIKVAAGYSYACAIRSDGTVWSWGYNWGGSLGDGGYSSRYAPVKAKGISHIVDIAAGEGHTVALRDDGTVWVWGANYYGALGDGTDDPSPYPKKVPGLTGIVAVAAGYYHTLALKSDGTLWAWGGNTDGQLGDGTLVSKKIPIQVPGLTGVASIDAAGYHSVISRTDGSVYTWGHSIYYGDNENHTIPMRVNGLSGIVSVETGYSHSFAFKRDGTIYGWGYNYYGQLGDGSTRSYYQDPVVVYRGIGVKKISAGSYHTAAVSNNGGVWTSGYNYYGQLGDGTNVDKSSPIQVPTLSNIIDVAAGDYFTVAINGEGQIVAWGSNDYGQLGRGYFTIRPLPEKIASLSSIQSISAGGAHSCAVGSGGQLYAWGYNTFGQLGDGTDVYKTTPITVPNLSVKKVAAGDDHTIVIKTDDTVWGFGYNAYGALGDGSNNYDRNSPVRSGSLTNMAAIAAGWEHTLAAAADGTLWAWGRNEYGSVGDGTTVDKSSPVKINGLTNVVQVAAYSDRSVALKSDGTVWVWGWIGDNNLEFSKVPIKVPGLSGITAITGGYYHLALKSDGTVWTWTSYDHMPSKVAGLSNIVAIASGAAQFAVENDGTLWAWGNNYYGQIGDGTTEYRSTPVEITSVKDVVAVSAGYTHTLALTKDGSVWSWGSYSEGQLGDGKSDFQPTPEAAIPVTMVNTPPSLGSVTPYYGTVVTGQWVTITSTYTDADGADELTNCNLLVNSTTINYQGAHFYYDQVNNKLFMKTNSGMSVPNLGVSPGTSMIIENENAKLDVAGTTITFRGETITIAWRVLFKPLMSKRYCNLYTYAKDTSGAVANWASKGRLYLAQNSAPVVESVSPADSTATIGKTATFTATYRDFDGASNINTCSMLINTSMVNSGGAHFFYNQDTNKFYMKNNAGAVIPAEGITPGMANVIESENAILDCKESTVTQNDDAITIVWKVKFKPGIGSKNSNIYLMAKDDGEAVAAWTIKGQLRTVTNTPPTLGTLTCAANITPETWNTVTTTYNDADGANCFGTCSLLINKTLTNNGGAHFYYDQISNKFYMKMDNGTVIGGVTPGTATIIESNNAVLYCYGSQVTQIGNTLKIDWRVKLKSPMALKNCQMYMMVIDDAGASVPWTSKGQTRVGAVPSMAIAAKSAP